MELSQVCKRLPPSCPSHFLNPFKAQVLTIGTVPMAHKLFQVLSNCLRAGKENVLALKYKEYCKIKLINISSGKLYKPFILHDKSCLFHVKYGYVFPVFVSM